MPTGAQRPWTETTLEPISHDLGSPRVALLGVGRWGRNLARVLHRLGVLACAVDPAPSARARLDEAGGSSVPLVPFEELPHRGVDAAVIATPAATHHAVALRCLDLGLDLFVEKPLTLDTESAEHLVEEAERRGRVLMVGHILLHHPAIHALERLVADDELGRLRYVYSHRLNLGRIRREENIVWSFAPHDVSVLLHLVGKPPTEVRAVGGQWLQPGIVDVTVTHLAFPGGVKGHVFVSWLHPAREQRLVVVGSRATAVFDDLQPRESKLVLVDSGVDVGEDGVPDPRSGRTRPVEIAKDEPLEVEMRHFLERCRDRERPLTDGRHALEVLRVLAEAERTLAERPVEQPSREPRIAEQD